MSDEAAPSLHHSDGNRTPPVTIYDVARVSGVSPSTVSRALNKPGRINAKTETRIREIASSLGYRLNPMARALPTGKTGTFALIVSDITNPVYFDLVRGCERVMAEAGLTLVFAESQESAEVEFEIAQRLMPSVDGLVLVGSRLSDEHIRLAARSKPLVIVNRLVDELPSVVPDPSPGIDAALAHLQHLGHRSIGYLSGPSASWIDRLRWQSLFELAVARSMSIVEIGAGAPTVEGGASSLPRVVASGVTAVIAYNDLMAMGMIRDAARIGLRIPGQLSVIGFDDIFGADLITPALTTIRSPLGKVGELAMRKAIDEANGAIRDDELALMTELVIRASTSSPHSDLQSEP